MFERADEVIAFARSCVGTPFVHQGRSPGVGLDCAGLGIVSAKAAGIFIKDFSGYPRTPFDGMLKKMFDEQKNLIRVDASDLSPGDILLMRFSSQPQHVAIMSNDGYIIHAYQNIGKVVEHRLDANWRRKIVAVYRLSL